jgi:hypothetical protein
VKDRAYEQVLGALLRLGCEIAREDEWFVVVVRGAAILQAIPKVGPVPVAIQRRILRVFSFTEKEYLDELTRPS